MVFSSLVFLCVFLPVLYLIYCILPGKGVKNGVLILASLLFYAYGEPVYVLLLIGSSLINYLGANLIAGASKGGRKKLILAMLVVANLCLLGVFKYTGFVVESLNRGLHLSLPVPEIALPIGISFFTFQIMSYVIDVYRGNVEVQKNYFKVLLYISFFPQLIAGPIVKYRDIAAEIDNRKASFSDAWEGFRRFSIGLGKKVLIANSMGKVADTIFNGPMSHVNILVAWIGAIAYLFQIYYDFSGYSDMAIGLGRMFGFHFNENFLYPYGAASIKEFWRKWHISLSTWFREYLYIPLGGNRKGNLRTSVNKMIVFFCTGLWHGASWTFVVWGLYHGAFLLLEDFLPAIRKLPKAIGHVYTLLVVLVGFVLFRAENIGQAGYMISQMFTGFPVNPEAYSIGMQQLTPFFLFMLVVAFLGMAPLAKPVSIIKERILGEGNLFLNVLVNLYVVFILVICMISLSGSAYNPFIYFRF